MLDGGLATQLEAQGADLSDRLWSARLLVEEPEAIVDAHLAFYRAGAQVATTATYQATFEGFAARGLDHEAAADLLRRSVDLAERAPVQRARRRGSPSPLFVAASVGPYGAMLADGSEYRGRYGRSVAELRDFHRERFRVLAATGADVLAVETIPEIEEARAVAGLLGELPGHRGLDQLLLWRRRPPARRGTRRGGGRRRSATRRAWWRSASTAPPRSTSRRSSPGSGPCRRCPSPSTPTAARAGTRRRGAGRGPRPERVDADAAARWRAAGATLIGGCCRVSPSQVGAMGQALAIAADG